VGLAHESSILSGRTIIDVMINTKLEDINFLFIALNYY